MATIKISIATSLRGIDGSSLTGDRIAASVRQAAVDATYGTYGEPVQPYKIAPEFQPTSDIRDVQEGEGLSYRVRFELGLPTAMFPLNAGGLQHLVGVLASDAFPTEALGCTWTNTVVDRIEFPEEYVSEARRLFGSGRDSVGLVRQSFDLTASTPLLAFSFKPRVGFRRDDACRTADAVLREGFDHIELDTRNLQDVDSTLEEGSYYASVAASVASRRQGFFGRLRPRAFAPNLSQRADMVLPAVRRWVEIASSIGIVPVVKVDGGLDGLSALHSIRTAGEESVRSVLTTCYPLLRGLVDTRVGNSGWVEVLALSGADIIYPGHRPRFIDDVRPIWTRAHHSYIDAAAWYDRLRTAYGIMPTIAGGAHPGHLHAAYELLGPDVAYFLGGAVLLHPSGAARGAKLCRRILDNSAALTAEAQRKGRAYSDWLPTSLIKEIEQYRAGMARYVPPEHVFGPVSPPEPPPLPFYKRVQS